MASEERATVLRSRLFVSGPVVRDTNFKDSARREAKSFGLRGWGRDTRDRRVEVLVEGEPEEVRQMIRWCYSDRSGAEVHSTSVYQETPSRDLTDFVIR